MKRTFYSLIQLFQVKYILNLKLLKMAPITTHVCDVL